MKYIFMISKRKNVLNEVVNVFLDENFEHAKNWFYAYIYNCPGYYTLRAIGIINEYANIIERRNIYVTCSVEVKSEQKKSKKYEQLEFYSNNEEWRKLANEYHK